MRFKIDDFIVITDIEIVELSEEMVVPTEVDKYTKKPSGYVLRKKTKEITVFKSISYFDFDDKKYYLVIQDIFVFIDLIEVLKSFVSNKLNLQKEYNLSDKFTAKIAQKNGDITLKIHFKNFSNSLYMDKFECSSLAAKFSKILQRCEAWVE